MNMEYVDDPVGFDGSAGTLVVIVRGGWVPIGTSFHTDKGDQQQVATIRRLPGEKIQAHAHKQVQRELWFTPEVFVVKTGKMRIDVYNFKREFVKSVEARGGDVVIVRGGGHGITFLEDTIFVEVKQGPYFGRDADKEDI